MIRGIVVPKVGICTVLKTLNIRSSWILAMEDYQDAGEFAKANYLNLLLSVLNKNIQEFVRRNRRLSPSERTYLVRHGFISYVRPEPSAFEINLADVQWDDTWKVA